MRSPSGTATLPPMKNEVTAGGIPPHRHRRRRTNEPSMSRGDSGLIEAMHDHLERCFPGWDGPVLHERISPTIHLDVMVVRPSADYPCLRLVTCGMAELPMRVPPQWSETPYAELTIALSPGWPVSMEAFHEERFNWPIQLLKHLARMPHEGATFLWTGHTAHGDRSHPYAPDTGLCASLIVPPMIAPPGFGELNAGRGRSVRILGVLPLYAEELEVKLRCGPRALADSIAAADLTDVVDPYRRAVIG
jgi:suppressor of fused protein SUFU